MTKKEHMHDKSDAELGELLAKTRASLREERFASAGSRPKDPTEKCKLRKVIARALTEERQRALKA